MRKKSSATPREDRSAGRRVHLTGKFKDEASARAVIERLRAHFGAASVREGWDEQNDCLLITIG